MENLNSNTEQILTDAEREKILLDLFKWQDWDLDASSFLYKWKWAELYEKASTSENYPFIEMEIKALDKLRDDPKFKEILKKTDYITDVWSWDGQKAITLLKWGWRRGTYIAEDPSPDMLNIVRRNMIENARWIKLWNFQVLNDLQWHLSSNLAHNMYLFLWGTIWNMSDKNIISELKNMDNNWIISGNKILLSYFTAPKTQEEIDNLIKIYGSKEDRAFHENGIDMLWLSKDDFEYDVIYEKDNPEQKEWPFPWRIKWIIRAKRDNVVELDQWRKIYIKKWEEFTLHYSRRFTKEWIEYLFKKSGCKVIFTEDLDNSSIVLLTRKPWKMKDTKSIIKKALAWTLIVWSLAGLGARHKQQERVKEQEEAYTEWETNNITNIDWTFYTQETDELISALSLDELDNEEYKQAIISLFNIYIRDHKTDWVSNEHLIQWFWDKYWWMLIKDFNLIHSPYDFITPEIIKNTSNLEWEIWYKQPDNIITTYHYDQVFEYNDWWERYFILRVNISPYTQIYMAAPVPKKQTGRVIPMSTGNVNNIKNKEWLDKATLSNNDKLWSNLITFWVSDLWRVRATDWHLYLCEDWVDHTWKTLHLVFINWDVYYIKIATTHSGKTIWLASKSTDWPFTISTFNEMADLFGNIRSNYIWLK